LTEAPRPDDYDHDYDDLTDFWLGKGWQYKETVEVRLSKNCFQFRGSLQAIELMPKEASSTISGSRDQ
jgi:hypothetical protein